MMPAKPGLFEVMMKRRMPQYRGQGRFDPRQSAQRQPGNSGGMSPQPPSPQPTPQYNGLVDPGSSSSSFRMPRWRF